ncbi:MAG: TraB/GumN family protein [Sporocytophaga sp.]|uniref:TraB/GumN family protein n=1 Tax=Sporocytophaga sp. TaxID=2231183 RepID=UPI001B270260|nr:TraB/GumN family protein [Sporocytophaga sp.]MBO9701101.1 TraB/GumN family protein [Sporocytophaga sp.]
MFRSAFIHFFLLLTLVFNTQAQTQKSRSNYQLLWKVTGNGLSKPSYVFGTMHLQDKRVYDFSDSVLVKLQECPSFAMEITPDSMLQYLFVEMDLDKDDTVNNIKAHLSPEEYDILNKKVIKETGFGIDKLKKKDAKSVAMLLSKPVPGKKDNATFLDAFLYKVASQQKKKLIGLEYSYEYNLLDSIDGKKNKWISDLKEIIYFDQVKEYSEKLISLYWAGDIQKIYASTGFTGSISMDIRNTRMADRMEANMKEMPVFTAVGAAHLPGQKGIIQLLRNKGYTVTPVQATFTGMAAKFKEKADENIWVNFTNEENGYAVDLPSNPFPNKSMTDKGINLYLYPDIASGLTYMTMTFLMPMEIKKGTESKMFKASIDNMLKQKNSKLLKSNVTTFNGYPSFDFEIYTPSDQMYSKGKMILRNKIYYMVFAGSYKRENLTGSDAEKYFKSFQFINFKNPGWKDYISEAGAYKVSVPFTMTEIKNEVNADSNLIAIAMASDPKEELAFGASYVNFKSGFYIFDDSLYLSSAVERMATSRGGSIDTIADIEIAGFPGKEFIVTSEGFSIRGRIVMRGSRPYTYFVIGDKKKISGEGSTNFLESFRFIEYDTTALKPFKYNEELVVNVPSEVSVDIDSSTYYFLKSFDKNFHFQDKNSGASYSLMITHYSKYYYNSESEYFKDVTDLYAEEGDSVISSKYINVDGINGLELVVEKGKINTNLKVLILPSGQNVYLLYTQYPRIEKESRIQKEFFSSFHLSKPVQPSFYQSKAALLLKDIVSEDSSKREEARGFLGYYKFEKHDLDLLHAAVSRSYDDDSLEFYSVRVKLFEALSSLNEPTTYGIIGKIYPSLDSLPGLQIEALKVLLGSKSKDGYAAFERLTSKKLPECQYSNNLFRAMADSIELNAEFLPKFFGHIKHPGYRDDLYDLAVTLIDSNRISPSYFKDYEQSIIEYFRADLTGFSDSTNQYVYEENLISATELMKNFPENSSYMNLLSELSKQKSSYVAIEAVRILLSISKKVDPSVIEKLASERDYRIRLYNILKEKDLLSLFPAKYLKQSYFAESDMASVLSDDMVTENIVLVNSKVKNIQGVDGRYYLYKYSSLTEEGKEEWYVGVSGPHPVDKTQVVTGGERTNYYYQTLKSKSLSEHYKALLEESQYDLYD